MMSMRKVLAAVLAGVLALPLLTAGAEAAEWGVERMSGDVQIHDGGSWVRLDVDRELNAGDSIWTGHNGRIHLMNDQGSVLLAPRSLVKIPAQTLPDNFSVLFQTHGKVSAEVNKRRTRHFSIQTPYLAAGVKGTKFDVEIERKRTRVEVREGLVGVADLDTGDQTDVAAGGSASTSNKDHAGLAGTSANGEALEIASTHGASPNNGNGGGNNGNGNGGGNNGNGNGNGGGNGGGKNK